MFTRETLGKPDAQISPLHTRILRTSPYSSTTVVYSEHSDISLTFVWFHPALKFSPCVQFSFLPMYVLFDLISYQALGYTEIFEESHGPVNEMCLAIQVVRGRNSNHHKLLRQGDKHFCSIIVGKYNDKCPCQIIKVRLNYLNYDLKSTSLRLKEL